jgi:hypothetical protein
MSDSKQGKVPSTDGALGLPTDPQRVFGESPVKRPISGGKHPPVRSDSTEQSNLRDATATMPLPP